MKYSLPEVNEMLSGMALLLNANEERKDRDIGHLDSRQLLYIMFSIRLYNSRSAHCIGAGVLRQHKTLFKNHGSGEATYSVGTSCVQRARG